jgi:hypothetical protein
MVDSGPLLEGVAIEQTDFWTQTQGSDLAGLTDLFPEFDLGATRSEILGGEFFRRPIRTFSKSVRAMFGPSEGAIPPNSMARKRTALFPAALAIERFGDVSL